MKDALLAAKDALLAAKDAQLASQGASLASLENSEREERRVAAAERELQTHLSDADASGNSRGEHVKEIARAKYEMDIEKGVVNMPDLLDACLADIWRSAPHMKAHVWRISGLTGTDSQQHKLSLLTDVTSGCPGLLAFLKLTGVENKVPEKDLLRAIESLSGRLQRGMLSLFEDETLDTPCRLPTDVLERLGQSTLVVLAAVVAFSGRDIHMYNQMTYDMPLRLLPPPLPTKAERSG